MATTANPAGASALGIAQGAMALSATIGAFQQASLSSSLTDINNHLAAVNANNANKVRSASNERAAAVGSLDRWMQSVNNNRLLKAGGEALEAHTVNTLRAADQSVTQSFADSVRAAESSGAQAAAAAFSGIDGNVVDMVNGSTILRDAISRQTAENQAGFVSYDAARRAGNITGQMIGGLDNTMILDTLDYNINVAQQQNAADPFQAGLLAAISNASKIKNFGTLETTSGAKTQASFSFADSKGSYLSLNDATPLWSSNTLYTYGQQP